MCKVAVGIRDLTHLRQVQAAQIKAQPPLRHRTRNAPRRADEILAGGSLYWVVAGALCVRQRILRIEPDVRADGTPCTGLFLDRKLVPTTMRIMKPFQGWRYLDAEDAPADLPPRGRADHDTLPPALRKRLMELCLL